MNRKVDQGSKNFMITNLEDLNFPVEILAWLKDKIAHCQPSKVHLCDASIEEAELLQQELCDQHSLIKLDSSKRPNSYLARSDPNDVARVEERTFICSTECEQAGPTNHWKAPSEMKHLLKKNFKNSMKGRVCYVIVFCMGPLNSPQARLGIQITDSAYVVLNMRLMTRMGAQVWPLVQKTDFKDITLCWHSVGAPLMNKETSNPWPCNPSQITIAHFPQDLQIWSYGSGYGGNALLSKKCMALRLASCLAKKQGWLAEHMLIMALISPENKRYYFAAAFPSACGKTNLAMMQPTLAGWQVECIGDDIAWMWIDQEGCMRAINPEAGFFGVAAGTSTETNPIAMQTIRSNTLFTNVALTNQKDIWWEGINSPRETEEEIAKLEIKNWLGLNYQDSKPAAHANSRFTVSLQQCPNLDPNWNNPEGIVISALIFGGRRSETMPLVMQAQDWIQGVLLASSLSSETTAAASGRLGLMRHDPFAMVAFCGYHIGDYFQHWLDIGKKIKHNLPIFYVNWFRKDQSGQLIWPGFGDNSRVLKWIADRLESKVGSKESYLGQTPLENEIDLQGLKMTSEQQSDLLSLSNIQVFAEIERIRTFFNSIGSGIPEELTERLSQIEQQLNNDLS
jgi:phosphoenolpyruvate carboxykinase (GTP)